MIQREKEMKNLHGLLRRHRVVGIIGARQVGKTTLARSLVKTIDRQVTFLTLKTQRINPGLPTQCSH
jgi:predicted AAA+ superfamily ATPase